MIKFWELTKRNLRIYFRDTGAIFFSLLSMLIVILLMVFFLGDMNINSITELLEQFSTGDAAEYEENARRLVYAWTCAGILSINAVTVTLAAYSGMLKDRVSGKLNAIYTSSAGRFTITASYVASAWLASVLVCVITLILVEGIGIYQGMKLFSLNQHLILFAMILVNSFVYAAMMYVLAQAARTEGAWGGIGTVIGTLVGFLGGIYTPVGTLSDTVEAVMKCTPVIYSSSMFRKIMTESVLEETFHTVPQEVVQEYRRVMGIDLIVFDRDLSIMSEWLILFACGMVFLMLGLLVFWKSRKTDR